MSNSPILPTSNPKSLVEDLRDCLRELHERGCEFGEVIDPSDLLCSTPWHKALDEAERVLQRPSHETSAVTAPVTSDWNPSRVCNGWDCWTCGAFVTHKMDATAVERDCLKCGPNTPKAGEPREFRICECGEGRQQPCGSFNGCYCTRCHLYMDKTARGYGKPVPYERNALGKEVR